MALNMPKINIAKVVTAADAPVDQLAWSAGYRFDPYSFGASAAPLNGISWIRLWWGSGHLSEHRNPSYVVTHVAISQLKLL